MFGASITVSSAGVAMALKLLGGAKIVKKFHARCIAEIEKMRLRNFKDQGKTLMDGGWQALAPATIERRRKGKKGGRKAQILRDTGELMNRSNWSKKSDEKHGELKSSGDKFTISGISYGIFHHQHDVAGNKIEGKGKLPERRILPLPDQAEPVCRVVGNATLADAIAGVAKAATAATGGL